MSFGERLQKVRKSMGMTQHQVAKEIGVDNSTYACYESGKRRPNSDIINKLIKVFEQNSIQLFEFPIIQTLTYPTDILDKLQDIMIEYGHPGGNYQEDKAHFDQLSNALAPLLALRNEALHFPSIDISSLLSGVTVKRVELDMRGEYLIFQCIELQQKLLESMTNRNRLI